MTRLHFREWLRRAKRHDRIVYYRGFLLVDRGSDDHKQRTEDQNQIFQLGDAVYDAHRAGLIFLFQKKTCDGAYDYWAVRA